MDKLRAYLEAPYARCPVWLDEGRTIAFISSRSGAPQIWQLDLVTKEYTQRTFENERIWSIQGNPHTGSILYCMDNGGNEREQVYVLSKDSASAMDITKEPDARHFLGGMSPDGKRVIYTGNVREFSSFDIWECNIETGEKRMILENHDNYNWPPREGLSPDGRYLLYNKLLGASNNALWMVDTITGKAVRIPDDDIISAETEPAWRRDSKGFYVLTNRDSQFTYVAYYDIEKASFSKFYEASWDVESLAVSGDDRYLAMIINEDGYFNLKIMDLKLNEEVNCIKPPKGVLSYYQQMSWSPKDHKLLFTVTSGKRIENIWLLDLDQDSMAKITDCSIKDINEEDLVEPTLCRFESFDGLSVPYWLYVPKGKEAKNLPVLIEIHGGPEGQELPEYNAFIQYLLSEGIAVVAPNVRGSTGYGKTYTHLDDVEKRLDSVHDIYSLVNYLVETGVADRNRLAVSGMSYGGFMTLSCATRYPDLWACAVDTVGMYNLETFLENTAEYRRRHRESEYGTLEHDREMLRRVSPIAKIDDITAPLMVIHGRNDPRVPVTEAESVVAYLRKKGLTVEFICYEDEGHGIIKLKNQLDCYPKIAAFLKKYLHI